MKKMDENGRKKMRKWRMRASEREKGTWRGRNFGNVSVHVCIFHLHNSYHTWSPFALSGTRLASYRPCLVIIKPKRWLFLIYAAGILS